MIINVGGRTDVVACYTDWLLRRLEEGYACVRNPLFPRKVSRYSLDPSVVDCILLGSKNYAPLLPHLQTILSRYNLYCFYTITAYGPDLEPNIPHIDKSIDTLLELSRIVGPKRIAWRYEPILTTSTYTFDVHCKTFERIAQQLTGHIDRCIFSFVKQQSKVREFVPDLVLLSRESKDAIARSLGTIAKQYRIPLQTCCELGNFEQYDIQREGCATLSTLGHANDCQFRTLKHSGTRPGCLCFDSREIGAYNCCPHGCLYCASNKTPRDARDNYQVHDPTSPLLIGTIGAEDEVRPANQTSYLLANQQDALPF